MLAALGAGPRIRTRCWLQVQVQVQVLTRGAFFVPVSGVLIEELDTDDKTEEDLDWTCI